MQIGEFLASIWRNAETYEVDSASASITVCTPPAGRAFAVLHLWLEAEGGGDVQVQSGTTDIMGPVAFGANDEKEWKNAPFPVFIGRAGAEAFKIVNGSTVQLNGFAVVGDFEKP